MMRIIGRLRILISLACVLNGALAGGDIYRYAIEVPAWRHLNIIDWAEYSRHADLGNGVMLFSFEAIVGALLLIFCTVIVWRNAQAFSNARWAVYTATFFSIGGLVFTFFAAPIMLSVPGLTKESESLQRAFDQFHFWGAWRSVTQVLSFFACVWAVGKVYDVKK